MAAGDGSAKCFNLAGGDAEFCGLVNLDFPVAAVVDAARVAEKGDDPLLDGLFNSYAAAAPFVVAKEVAEMETGDELSVTHRNRYVPWTSKSTAHTKCRWIEVADVEKFLASYRR